MRKRMCPMFPLYVTEKDCAFCQRGDEKSKRYRRLMLEGVGRYYTPVGFECPGVVEVDSDDNKNWIGDEESVKAKKQEIASRRRRIAKEGPREPVECEHFMGFKKCCGGREEVVCKKYGQVRKDFCEQCLAQMRENA